MINSFLIVGKLVLIFKPAENVPEFCTIKTAPLPSWFDAVSMHLCTLIIS
jgi:hypothetical protein